MLHRCSKSVPLYPLAVNVDEPQLFTTDTDGVAGVLFGAAVPLPAALDIRSPFVTVYGPPIATVMEGAVAPLLH